MDDPRAADRSGEHGQEPVPHTSGDRVGIDANEDADAEPQGTAEQSSGGLEDDELADVLEGQLLQATSSIPVITSFRALSPTSDDLFAALMDDLGGTDSVHSEGGHARSTAPPAEPSTSFDESAYDEPVVVAEPAPFVEPEPFVEPVVVDESAALDETVWIEPAFYEQQAPSVGPGAPDEPVPVMYDEPVIYVLPAVSADPVDAVPLGGVTAEPPQPPPTPFIPYLVEPPGAFHASPAASSDREFLLASAPPPTLGSNVVPAGDFALPQPPPHRSLADHELVSVVQGSLGTSGALAELEMQLELRKEEAHDFEEWERAMLAIGSRDAHDAIEKARNVRAERQVPLPPTATQPPPDPAEQSLDFGSSLDAEFPTVLHPLVEPISAAPAIDFTPDVDSPAAHSLAQEWPPVMAVSGPAIDDFIYSGPSEDGRETQPEAPGAGVGSDRDTHGPLLERNEGEPTADELRTSRAVTMFWLWFAPHSSVIGIAVGASLLTLGLSLRQAIVAVLVGVALSMIPLALGTLSGRSTGQPAMVASRAVFGVVGNILPAVLSAGTRVLWACALAVVCGGAVSALTTQLTGVESAPWVAVAAAVVVLALGAAIAVVGYSVIVRVAVVLGVLSAVLVVALIAATAPSIDLSEALLVPDGSWVGALSAAVFVFCVVGLAWATSGADIARYQRAGGSGAPALAWTMAGCSLPAIVVIGYGAILAFSTPDAAAALISNPAAGLASVVPSWFFVPLLVLLVSGLTCGVTIALYSAGFGLTAAGVLVARPVAIAVAAVLALACALALSFGSESFGVWFRDGVTTLAVPVAAWVGIVGADFLLRRRPLDGASLMRRGGAYPHVNVTNLIAFVAISVVGWGFTSAALAGLAWQGYFWPLIGVAPDSAVASTDIGVIVALVLGLVVPPVAGVPAIRRQEALQR